MQRPTQPQTPPPPPMGPPTSAETSGRTGRPSRRARNGTEARTCRAMPRHSVVERSRIAFAMKIFLAAHV